jgi:hypothetical protein
MAYNVENCWSQDKDISDMQTHLSNFFSKALFVKVITLFQTSVWEWKDITEVGGIINHRTN